MAYQCPVSKDKLLSQKPLRVTIAGVGDIDIPVGESPRGSAYFTHSERYGMMVDGVECDVMVGINITFVGSKRI